MELLEHCDTVVGICVFDWSQLVADAHGLQVRKFLLVDERLVAGDSLRYSPEAILSCGYLADTLDDLIIKLEDCMPRSDLGGRMTLSSSKELPDAVYELVRGDDVWSGFGTDTYVKAAGTPSTYLVGKTISTSPNIISTEYCHPGVFFKVMGDYLDDDAVVCADIGDNSLFVASALHAKRGQRFLTVSKYGNENHDGRKHLSTLTKNVPSDFSLSAEQASGHHELCHQLRPGGIGFLGGIIDKSLPGEEAQLPHYWKDEADASCRRRRWNSNEHQRARDHEGS